MFTYAHRAIPSNGTLTLVMNTDACAESNTAVNYLEHVQAVITLNASRRGDVTVYLTSPMGTR